jgi:hypothetical protein
MAQCEPRCCCLAAQSNPAIGVVIGCDLASDIHCVNNLGTGARARASGLFLVLPAGQNIHLRLCNGNRLALRLDCETMLLGLMVEPSRTGFVATTPRLRQEGVVSLPLRTVATQQWLGGGDRRGMGGVLAR